MRRLTLIALILLAPRMHAGVWIVDAANGPGADFKEIYAAVAAPEVLIGDVLAVRAGSYGPFTLDKNLVVIGESGTLVAAPVQIGPLIVLKPAGVVGLRTPYLSISGCAGTILIEDVVGLEQVDISGSADVRVVRSPIVAPVSTSNTALTIDSSRVEIDSSDLAGGTWPNTWGACPHAPGGGFVGGIALLASNSARVHLVESDALGGHAEYQLCPDVVGGNGRFGIQYSASEILIAGGGQCLLRGGAGGPNYYYQYECSYDGPSASAVRGSIVPVRTSGATTKVYPYYWGIHCLEFTPSAYDCPTVKPALPDPTLAWIGGTPSVGQSIQLRLTTPAASSITLLAGRKPTVVATPGMIIEELVAPIRSYPLGSSAGGTLILPFNVPSNSTTGSLLVFQVEITIDPGDVRRTNSIPIVVR